MQPKSALVASYSDWLQATGLLLEGNARPDFLGPMRDRALAIEASASGLSAWWAMYRLDGDTVDQDRYATSGTANHEGYVAVRHLCNGSEHHLSTLPDRLRTLSGIRK